MIGEKTIETITRQIEILLNDYIIEIDGAFDPDDGMNISLKAELRSTGNSGITVKSHISFVTGKVKDCTDTSIINELQKPMRFEDE